MPACAKLLGNFGAQLRSLNNILGGGAVVDLRFQFQEGVDFKKGFEKLQPFEGVAK